VNNSLRENPVVETGGESERGPGTFGETMPPGAGFPGQKEEEAATCGGGGDPELQQICRRQESSLTSSEFGGATHQKGRRRIKREIWMTEATRHLKKRTRRHGFQSRSEEEVCAGVSQEDHVSNGGGPA